MQLTLSAPDFRYIPRDGAHTQHAFGFRVPDQKVLIGYRNLFFRLPVPEIRFTVPSTLVEHGSDDDIGSKRALVVGEIIGYLRVLDRIIRRQTHHSSAGRIDVNGSPVGIGDADEVRRVFEKRHEYV